MGIEGCKPHKKWLLFWSFLQDPNPLVLSTGAIEPGVDLLLEAGMDRLRDKSVAQSEYLIELWRDVIVGKGRGIDPRVSADHYFPARFVIGGEETPTTDAGRKCDRRVSQELTASGWFMHDT